MSHLDQTRIVTTAAPGNTSANDGDTLAAENRRLRHLNNLLLNACKAVQKTCGPAEDWNGETYAFLRLVETALAEASLEE